MLHGSSCLYEEFMQSSAADLAFALMLILGEIRRVAVEEYL